MEDVAKQQWTFFLFLNLDKALGNSTPGEFAFYLTKPVGKIPMKIEKRWIHFLSDIFPATAILVS